MIADFVVVPFVSFVLFVLFVSLSLKLLTLLKLTKFPNKALIGLHDKLISCQKS